jgi:RNA methyltransferase, TrmH family
MVPQGFAEPSWPGASSSLRAFAAILVRASAGADALKRITSRHNALVARCRTVRSGDDRSRILLDGAHLVAEAFQAKLRVEQLVVTAEAAPRPDVVSLVGHAERHSTEVVLVSASVMAAIAPVRTPTGVVALAVRPEHGAERVYRTASPLVVIAVDVQDPGNVGAIVRVAEAAGASGFIASGSCADPFGWKALRGSMGSALRLPIDQYARPDQALGDARRHGCRIAAAVPRGGTSFVEAPLIGPLAVLIGGEGPGLFPEISEQADIRVTIPMAAPVESLNAAVTAALLLYEAGRQRHSAAAARTLS